MTKDKCYGCGARGKLDNQRHYEYMMIRLQRNIECNNKTSLL